MSGAGVGPSSPAQTGISMSYQPSTPPPQTQTQAESGAGVAVSPQQDSVDQSSGGRVPPLRTDLGKDLRGGGLRSSRSDLSLRSGVTHANTTDRERDLVAREARLEEERNRLADIAQALQMDYSKIQRSIRAQQRAEKEARVRVRGDDSRTKARERQLDLAQREVDRDRVILSRRSGERLSTSPRPTSSTRDRYNGKKPDGSPAGRLSVRARDADPPPVQTKYSPGRVTFSGLPADENGKALPRNTGMQKKKKTEDVISTQSTIRGGPVTPRARKPAGPQVISVDLNALAQVVSPARAHNSYHRAIDQSSEGGQSVRSRSTRRSRDNESTSSYASLAPRHANASGYGYGQQPRNNCPVCRGMFEVCMCAENRRRTSAWSPGSGRSTEDGRGAGYRARMKPRRAGQQAQKSAYRYWRLSCTKSAEEEDGVSCSQLAFHVNGKRIDLGDFRIRSIGQPFHPDYGVENLNDGDIERTEADDGTMVAFVPGPDPNFDVVVDMERSTVVQGIHWAPQACGNYPANLRIQGSHSADFLAWEDVWETVREYSFISAQGWAAGSFRPFIWAKSDEGSRRRRKATSRPASAAGSVAGDRRRSTASDRSGEGCGRQQAPPSEDRGNGQRSRRGPLIEEVESTRPPESSKEPEVVERAAQDDVGFSEEEAEMERLAALAEDLRAKREQRAMAQGRSSQAKTSDGRRSSDAPYDDAAGSYGDDAAGAGGARGRAGERPFIHIDAQYDGYGDGKDDDRGMRRANAGGGEHDQPREQTPPRQDVRGHVHAFDYGRGRDDDHDVDEDGGGGTYADGRDAAGARGDAGHRDVRGDEAPSYEVDLRPYSQDVTGRDRSNGGAPAPRGYDSAWSSRYLDDDDDDDDDEVYIPKYYTDAAPRR